MGQRSGSRCSGLVHILFGDFRYCTVSVRLTECVSPAAHALIVMVEIPGGVGVPPPPVVPVVGIARLAPQLLSAPSAQSMTSKRVNRG